MKSQTIVELLLPKVNASNKEEEKIHKNFIQLFITNFIISLLVKKHPTKHFKLRILERVGD